VRIAFFGSPLFAVPSLERLIASSHPVIAVVTQPDKPRGRGHHVSEGPVKKLAVAHKIPVLQPERLKTPPFAGELARLSPDLGVVAAYGKILPADLLQVPPRGFINVHASLLPRWRGAAPVQRAVMAGDAETGVTIMRVVAELDAGPTFASVRRRISGQETAEEVERDLASRGAGLLVDIVERMAEGAPPETPQDDSLATYAPRVTKGDGAIDWSRPAGEIHDKVRGLHPWPHASSVADGARYIILRTAVEPSTVHVPPGSVIEASGDRLLVATGEGVLRIHEIQAEGRRPMGAREFLAGHRFAPGTRFGQGDG
jgi:methionyl-tRNA formyltransferase